jgi:hypothetical protein
MPGHEGSVVSPHSNLQAEGYALAGGLGVLAIVLIAVGLLLGAVRRMIRLAKLAIALGFLTIVAAAGTAAVLIRWF